MIRTMLACAAVGAFVIATVPNAAIAADMPASYKPTKAKKVVGKKAASNAQKKSRYYPLSCEMHRRAAYATPAYCR